MQNLYNYWDAALTQAANLKIELLHLNGAQDNPGGQQQLIDFMGNPTLNPPSTGTFQANEAANGKLLFPAVPVGTVINTRDRTMWETDYPLENDAACSAPSGPPTYSQSLSPLLSPITWNGLTGFTSPSLTEMQSLITGWTGANPNNWLTAQTQAIAPDFPLTPGFANFSDVLAGGCQYLAWTSIFTGNYYSYNGHQYPMYYVMSLYSGKTDDFPSGYELAGLHNWNLIFLTRSLSQGEQYFWYD